MKEVPFTELYGQIIEMMERELPSFLTYHSTDHTKYVIQQAEVISNMEGIQERELYLIKVAALFHDIGFIRQYKDHESAGCEIAWNILDSYNFSREEMEQICGMIMATKIPQRPNTISEMIVADADLEYLGTALFEPISHLLYKEMHYLDPNLSESDFNLIQINFLRKHAYHTSFCKQFREDKKMEHLRRLEAECFK